MYIFSAKQGKHKEISPTEVGYLYQTSLLDFLLHTKITKIPAVKRLALYDAGQAYWRGKVTLFLTVFVELYPERREVLFEIWSAFSVPTGDISSWAASTNQNVCLPVTLEHARN